MMPKGSKSNCKSASHKAFKDKAKNRVDDLQVMFSDLQYARKESRSVDVAVLEEQVHQMLREWKSELHEPSPASSLQGGSLVSFGSSIDRLLQLYEEEDDATSTPAALKSEPDAQNVADGGNFIFQEEFSVNEQDGYHSLDEYKGSHSGMQTMTLSNLESANQMDSCPYQLPHDFEPNYFTGLNGTSFYENDVMPNNPCLLSNVRPPPSAFLGPKCSLWDCPRPAQGLDWSQQYCNIYHSNLAVKEGSPGEIPVVRPGGIGLKDGLLFMALSAKSQGKGVGIPECEGAASAKSPWNASELFDLNILVQKGERIREWLFFDKPRRAFESGNRKQRSLPDYSGRGWHESRKQVVKECDGLKRSYYMDPQPSKQHEWHLFEYEINKCDAWALYRLELKLVDENKTPKGKVTKDSLADLQKQMGRLSAEVPYENKSKPSSGKGRSRLSSKDRVTNVDSMTDQAGTTNITPNFDTSAPDSYPADNFQVTTSHS